MAKKAGAGEMQTRIVIKDFIHSDDSAEGGDFDADGYPISARDQDGYEEKDYFNVFDEDKICRCKWVNVHGAEVFAAHQAQLREPATLTMRYSPKITPTCIIYRLPDPKPYEVISINDVEDRHTWLEIKVQRRVISR